MSVEAPWTVETSMRSVEAPWRSDLHGGGSMEVRGGSMEVRGDLHGGPWRLHKTSMESKCSMEVGGDLGGRWRLRVDHVVVACPPVDIYPAAWRPLIFHGAPCPWTSMS